MKNASLLLSILNCIFLLQSIKAEDAPWFEIEIILFEQSNQSRLDSEKWEKNVQLPERMESIDFLTLAPALQTLKQLCIAGNRVPIIANIPVTAVVEAINNDINILTGATKNTFLGDPDQNNINAITGSVGNNNPPDNPRSSLLTVENQQPIEPPQTETEELPFVILDAEHHQLNPLYQTLKRRRGFRPLLHTSWRQPVLNKQQSQLLRIFTGKNYSDTFNPAGDARIEIATIDNSLFAPPNRVEGDTETLLLANTLVEKKRDETTIIKSQLAQCHTIITENIEARPTDVWQIDGTLRIYVRRYLHLQTDLYLSIPGKKTIELGSLETSLAVERLLNTINMLSINKNKIDDNGFGWQLGDDFLNEQQSTTTIIQDVLNKYSMQQSRRMRSNEIHYIDHPLFGLLIQIRPYKKDIDVPAPSL